MQDEKKRLNFVTLKKERKMRNFLLLVKDKDFGNCEIPNESERNKKFINTKTKRGKGVTYNKREKN